MASRVGVTLPSLVNQMCPELRSALAMRAVSRCLQLAISNGVLCTLVLSDRRLAEKSVLDSCGAKLPVFLCDAVVWGRLLVPALVETLASFAALLCPHVRYFANEEVVLKQIRLTLHLLSHLHCKDCLRGRARLHRMAACNGQVRIALEACLAR
jgi:hypothetical protein